jgi:hypothetical protein
MHRNVGPNAEISVHTLPEGFAVFYLMAVLATPSQFLSRGGTCAPKALSPLSKNRRDASRSGTRFPFGWHFLIDWLQALTGEKTSA